MNGLHRKKYLIALMKNLASRLIHVLRKKTISVTNTSLRKTTASKSNGGGDRVFCNPPYSAIGKWVEKAYRETRNDNTLVVLLIPARTDTRYFHDFIYNRAEIRFVKGRLKFGQSKNSAPFPSMVVIFRGAYV